MLKYGARACVRECVHFRVCVAAFALTCGVCVFVCVGVHGVYVRGCGVCMRLRVLCVCV